MKLNILKKGDIGKALALSLIASIGGFSLYMGSEPSIAEAVTATSNNVIVTMNVDAGISITSPGNTTMSTNLGVTANSAVASSVFTVATNNTLGYSLSIAASTTPAMKNVSDSVPDAATTPALWAVASGASQFGFSVYGTDVTTATYGTGASCQAAANTPSATLKYRGFTGTTGVTLAGRSATTTPTGVSTTLCYAVGQNNTYIPSGVYTATFTATATTL